MLTPTVVPVSVEATGHDGVLVALYRLELAILPHVATMAERKRRLRRMSELRQGLPQSVQSMLIVEFIRAGR
jgi:hypothetical protein